MKKLENLLAPEPAIIKKVASESDGIKSFLVEFENKALQKKLKFLPGRFMEISIFGFGEMPISIASSPLKKDSMLFAVNDVGNISHAMHQLKEGDLVGIRGPYGNGFPLQGFLGKNLVVVAGGCGLAGLRSLLETIELQREKFGSIDLFYGARAESGIIFKRDLERWKKTGFKIHVSVDTGKKRGNYFVGFVTALMKKTRLSAKGSLAVFCGPGKMTEIAVNVLKKKGFKESQMHLSLERLMHCGMGKCAHCNFGHKYVCVEGPVFRLDEINKLPWKKE